jgi:hypothetical protein
MKIKRNDKIKDDAGNVIGGIVEGILEEAEGHTINAHYGFKREEYEEMIGDLLKDIFMADDKSFVLDKHFVHCDAKTRLKIAAYHEANRIMNKGHCCD